MNENLYLYIIIRNDLSSLGAGRAAAQASHAANAFIYEYGELKKNDIKSWQSQTIQGFGTAIVLSASETEIDNLLKLKELKNFPKEWVIDPDYVISVTSEVAKFLNSDKLDKIEVVDQNKVLLYRKEKTCAYIFGDKEELKPFLGQFPLYS